jgi:hypothetical protein
MTQLEVALEVPRSGDTSEQGTGAEALGSKAAENKGTVRAVHCRQLRVGVAEVPT